MINSEAPQPSALNDRQVRGRYCGASLRHGQQVQPVRELGLMVDPDIYDDLLDCNHFTMILGFCVIERVF